MTGTATNFMGEKKLVKICGKVRSDLVLCKVGLCADTQARQGCLQTETVIKLGAQVALGHGDPEEKRS